MDCTGPAIRSIERSRNTALADPLSKVNVMTLTYCAARLRYQNTDVSAHKIDLGLQRAGLEELHNAVAMPFGRHQEG